METQKPLVSIIIPCYNHGKFIIAAIQSVKQQAYANYEIIVIDDGSTDIYTQEVLKGLENTVKVLRQQNAGPSVARNYAIKQSAGKYLLPLDSDNKIRPGYIEKAVAILEQSPEIGVVYSDFQFFGGSEKIVSVPDFEIQKMLVYNFIDICCVFRRQVFDDTGGFDEYMSKRGLEDWEFWIAVHQRGWKFRHIAEVLFDYFQSEQSRTVQVANNNIEDLKRHVYSKHSLLIADELKALFYQNKMLKETPDYRIGNLLMQPYRAIKKLLKG